MTVVALASIKSSPGVTTAMLALAATWPPHRPLLLIEADPDGGDLAARAGLAAEPGLVTLAAASRRALAPGEGDRHIQRLPGGLPIIIGPADGPQATQALEIVGRALCDGLRELRDRDVLIDCGRLRPSSPALGLATAADRLIVVARPRLDELHRLRPALTRLTAAGAELALLLIGERPYAAAEVTRVLDVPVLASLPHDPAAAALLNGQGGRAGRLAHSSLVRAARSVADALTSGVPHPSAGHREPLVSAASTPAPPSPPLREPSVSAVRDRERSRWVDALTRGSPTDGGRTDGP